MYLLFEPAFNWIVHPSCSRGNLKFISRQQRFVQSHHPPATLIRKSAPNRFLHCPVQKILGYVHVWGTYLILE